MKKCFKKLLIVIGTILVLPFVLIVTVTKSVYFFGVFSQLFSLLPDCPGTLIRSAFYASTLKRCSRDVVICFGTYFTKREVEIGKGVYIGGNCCIGMCIINDNATIASNVSILSGKKQHGYRQIDVPIQQQGGSYQQIIIGENCWIGQGAIIMANLGKQNIVAAGTVVTYDTNDYDIVVGNPAKVVNNLCRE